MHRAWVNQMPAHSHLSSASCHVSGELTNLHAPSPIIFGVGKPSSLQVILLFMVSVVIFKIKN